MRPWILLCLVTWMMFGVTNGAWAQDCSVADAGTFSVQPFEPSSEITPDREYTLCFGQSIRLDHDDNFNLGGDPDPSSTPGIGYLVLEAAPTVSGASWDEIIAGNSVVMNGGQPLIIYGDESGHAAIFQNLEALNMSYKSVWLAPITLHDISEARAGNPSDEGSCAQLNANDAVKVNLLKRIEIEVVNQGMESISIRVTGGLPEWDNGSSSYSYTVVENIGTSYTEVGNGVVEFNTETTVPTGPDTRSYIIEIQDEQGCMGELIDLDPNTDSTVKVEIGCVDAKPGEIVCVPVFVSGVSQIQLFTFYLQYDASVIEFVNVNNPQSFYVSEWFINDGDLVVRQLGNTVFPVPGGERALFLELCFRVVGSPGEYSALTFNRPFSTIFSFDDNATFRAEMQNCQVNVINDQTELYYDYTACASDDGTISLSLFDITGVGPYSLEVTDGSGASVISMAGLNANDAFDFTIPAGGSNPYTIRLSDAQGLSRSYEDVELEATVMSFQIDSTLPSCGNANGSITITSYTGSDSSQFLLYSPDGSFPQAFLAEDIRMVPITGLISGTYRLEMRSPNGKCILSREVVLVGDEIAINLDISQDIADCNDGGMTRVGISVRNYTGTMGGVSSPTDGSLRRLIVRNLVTDQEVERFDRLLPADTSVMLPQGSYAITATDAAGCTHTEYINIWPQNVPFPVTDTLIKGRCPDPRMSTQNARDGICLKFNDLYEDVVFRFEYIDSSESHAENSNQTADVNPDDSIINLREPFPTGLFPGTFLLEVSHPDFCYSPLVFVFELQELEVGIDADIVVDNYCDEMNQGSIRIDSLLNWQNLDYRINFNNDIRDTVFSPGITFDSLQASNAPYRIIITEANSGCRINRDVIIESEGVDFEITGERPPVCPNANEGSFRLSLADGDVLDSLWVVDPITGMGRGYSGPIEDGFLVEGLSGGVYEAHGFGSTGCMAVRDVDIVNPADLPELRVGRDFVEQQPVCAEDEVLVLVDTTDVINNGLPYSEITYVVGDQSNPRFNLGEFYTGQLEEGKYPIWLDYNGCLSEVDSIEIIYDDDGLPFIRSGNAIVIDQPSCTGDQAGIRLNSSNVNFGVVDSSAVRFVIGNPNGQRLELDSTYSMPMAPGRYPVYLVTDNCFSPTTDSFTINQGMDPQPQLDMAVYSAEAGETITLQEVSGELYSLYQWQYDGQAQQTIGGTYGLVATQSGTLELIVEDQNGCVGVTTAQINVNVRRDLQYPNVFSPSAAQNENRVFKPFISTAADVRTGLVESFAVFDRYGRQVWLDTNVPVDRFTINDESYGWDGTFNGTELPPDVYVFVIKVQYEGLNDVVSWSGAVTLLR